MGQTWYVQHDDRTIGPLTSRQLHTLSRSGELTPEDRVSLDARSWFRAAKVLGLFPDPAAGAKPIPPPAEGDLDLETFEGAGKTRLLEPDPSRGDATKTLIESGHAQGLGGGEKTRIETLASPVVGNDRPTSTWGPALASSKAVAVPVLRIGWRGIRAVSIAGVLLVVWGIRSGVGLLRRRKVARTAFESKLSASLWSRPGSVGPTSPTPMSGTFGRYQIIRPLGKGGMGAVYLATDSQLGRQIALKVPHFSAEDGPEVLERFDREARAAAMLDHPNVCPIYDVGTIDGVPYASMAYIEGRPLADLVDADKRLAERESAVLVRKVALAMAEAHLKGIIHRDLKPANIMINPRREPVIMDFGLARRSGAGDSKLTKNGAIVGTPSYMSPEQVGGNPDDVGPSCDIYSLGVVLYELLTGRLPFEGPVMAVLGQILSAEPAPPSVHRPEVDHQLEAICRKAMAKKPGDRFSSMVDFAKALSKYLKAHPQEDGLDEGEDVASWSEFFALPPRPAENAATSVAEAARGRRPIWALAAAVLLLAGSVVVLASLNREATVQVTLSNFQVNNIATKVYYFLDGKEIDADALSRPINIPTGTHKLALKNKDGALLDSKMFNVETVDQGKTVDVKRPFIPSPGSKGKVEAIELLVDRVSDAQFVEWFYDKNIALEALEKRAPERVNGALLAAFKHKNYDLQIWATRKLKERGVKSAVQPIFDRLIAPDYCDWFANKEAYLDAIKALEPERAEPALNVLMGSADVTLKSWAAKKLGDLGGPPSK